MNKIILLLILVLGQSLNAQISSLTEDELKAKIQLDTKVEISKSYMKVSGYTTLLSIGVTIGAPNFYNSWSCISWNIYNTIPYNKTFSFCE